MSSTISNHGVIFDRKCQCRSKSGNDLQLLNTDNVTNYGLMRTGRCKGNAYPPTLKIKTFINYGNCISCVYTFLDQIHSPFSIETFITRNLPFFALPNTLASCSLAENTKGVLRMRIMWFPKITNLGYPFGETFGQQLKLILPKKYITHNQCDRKARVGKY